jgi:hypothetical protein
MIVVSCPCCGDNVLAPSGVSTDATVRCPLCMDEFTLSSALGDLPPSLIVLDQPAMTINTSVGNTSVGNTSVGKIGAEQAGMGDATPSFQFEDGSAPVQPRVQVRQPTNTSKGKNIVFEFVKVILGGFLGLAIGQLLLWRIPGEWPSHQRDPFSLGEKYGHVFPINYLAPISVRDPGSSSEVESRADDGSITRPSQDFGSQPGRFDSGRMVTPDGSEESRVPTNGDDTAPSPRVISSSELPDLPGIINAPRVAGSQLNKAVAEAKAAQERWASGDGDREAESYQIVETVADLAFAVTFIQPARSVPKATEPVLRELLGALASSDLRPYLHSRNPLPESNSQGFIGELLVGTVGAIQLNGELFQTELSIGDEKLNVCSTDDPRERYTVGDEAAILAVWVPSPGTQIAGLETPRERVYFGEFSVRLTSDMPVGNAQPPAVPPTDEPATDEPTTAEPATDEPATDEPATDEPATDEPATDEPATDEPTTADDAPSTEASTEGEAESSTTSDGAGANP